MGCTVEPLCKGTPEMRTSPLIRIFDAVPRVSRIEGFHCIVLITNLTYLRLEDGWLALE